MTLDRLRHIVRLRLRSLFAGALADRELDEELQFHVDRQIEAHIARGVSPDEARRLALRAIGGVELRKEQMRDARGITEVENVVRDVRLACRQLRKQPAFTFTAIASLALGIGANVAIFQLLTALSLRPLPVRAPHELVEVRLTGDGRDGRHTGRNRQVSLPQYREFAARQEVFSSMLAFGDTRFNLSASGEVRYVDGLWVSGNFFEMLGVQPLLGRLIEPADDRQGCEAAGVISYALWQSEFGGRPDIIGQRLPGVFNATIVGVTPREFFGVEVGRQFGVALPICASGLGRIDHWWLAAVGRLKPGVTRAAAAAQLKQIMPQVQEATLPPYRRDLADNYLNMGVEVVDASSGLSPLRRSYQRPLWILLGISGLVLLIAAVNLANLLLARATARRAEFAVRLALGGSRRRVLQQVLTESGVIAVLGSIAALGVALAASESIPPLISTAVDRIHLDVSLDWRIFGFTAAAASVTALIFGTAPAWRAANASLRTGGRGSAANDGLSLRRSLVAAQIAVTLVLLFGGLLFLQTFRNLANVNIGVRGAGVVIAVVFFTDREYPAARRPAAYAALDELIATLPGVDSMSDAHATPLGGSFWDTDIQIGDRIQGDSYGNRIGTRYFETMGTPLLAGRDFDSRDGPGSPTVAIVNQSFAAKYLSGHPVGQHFTIPSDTGGAGRRYEVVGLVGDQKYGDLREVNTRIFFVPSAQEAELPTVRRYVIRSSRPAAATIAAVGRAVAGFDSSLSVRYSTLENQIAEGMLQERLMARLSTLFGVVALALAIVGIYGVVSYMVASRRSEIGVRLALGASRAGILQMILADMGRTIAVGAVIGGILALLAARGAGSLLYGVSANDPATMAAAALLLAVAGMLSAAWPAQRATRVDPISTLREN
jgi:predicted permease